MSDETQGLLTTTMELMAALFIIVVGLVVLWAIIAFIVDITQTRHAIRRNYPVIGRFRYFFEKCVFRTKSATDSIAKLPPIPRQACH